MVMKTSSLYFSQWFSSMAGVYLKCDVASRVDKSKVKGSRIDNWFSAADKMLERSDL
jgi:hypothetical protein